MNRSQFVLLVRHLIWFDRDSANVGTVPKDKGIGSARHLANFLHLEFLAFLFRVPTRPGKTWKNESPPGKPGNIMEFCKI